MTGNPDDSFDWSATTWKGSRREQHRQFHALPFARKLEIVEEMRDQTARMIEERRRRGLPYIDPYTREVVRPPTPNANPAEMSVGEPPPPPADMPPRAGASEESI